MVYRHLPTLSGRKPLPHVQCNSWFPVGNDGGRANEANQIELLRAYAPLGIEYLVMDAGWYGTTADWGANTGTWTPRKDAFPNGLEPVGHAASKAGIRFGMWFEPERRPRHLARPRTRGLAPEDRREGQPAVESRTARGAKVVRRDGLRLHPQDAAGLLPARFQHRSAAVFTPATRRTESA